MTHAEKTCSSADTSRCCQDTQQISSLGIGFWCRWKSSVAVSIDRKKHSSTNDESAGTAGCTQNSVNATPCTHTPWTFSRGLRTFWASLDCWTRRCLGTAHLDWSIPSWVQSDWSGWNRTSMDQAGAELQWIRLDQDFNGSEGSEIQ